MISSYASPLRNFGITACEHCNTSAPFIMCRRGDTESRHFNLLFILEGTQLLEAGSGDLKLKAVDFMSIPS